MIILIFLLLISYSLNLYIVLIYLFYIVVEYYEIIFII